MKFITSTNRVSQVDAVSWVHLVAKQGSAGFAEWQDETHRGLVSWNYPSGFASELVVTPHEPKPYVSAERLDKLERKYKTLERHVEGILNGRIEAKLVINLPE